MFEQSIVQPQHTKAWTLGVSLTLQASLVAAAILLSMLSLQRLDITVPRNPLLAPRLPKPVEVMKVVAVVRTGFTGLAVPAMASKPLFAPRTIPQGVPKIEDAGAEAPVLTSGAASGAMTGVGSLPAGFGVSTDVPRAPAPAKPARTAVAAPSAPIRVSTGVMEAKILRRVMPVYPMLAKNARVQGKVHLLGIIAKDGTIQKLQVIDGHPLLINAAVEAVKQWLYQPTLLNGDPVEVITPIEVNFTLSQ